VIVVRGLPRENNRSLSRSRVSTTSSSLYDRFGAVAETKLVDGLRATLS
jgi:hypothetical protein